MGGVCSVLLDIVEGCAASVVGAATGTVRLSRKENAALDTITEGTNKFAVNLYQALASNQAGNVFVSPLSVQVVLALAYTGAKGDTAKELATLLSLPDNIKDTYAGYQSLIKVLRSPVLKLANGMFVEKKSGFKEGFKKNAKKYFQSPAKALDFCSACEESREYINAWVENKTNKKITNLLQQGVIDNLTRLVLVNAIHFKADWVNKFHKEKTKEEEFHVSLTKTVRVPMMHIKKKFYFAHDKEMKAKLLQLDYEQKNFNMIVILPDKIDGLSALEANLDKVSLNEKISHMEEEKVIVALPKFKMEETMELNDILKSLGVKTMFDNHADFSGLSDNRLKVSNVVQKAFVEVHEEGTEAVAATGITSRLYCAVIEDPPRTFVADHPFIFIIKRKDQIMFIGRLNGPHPIQ